MKSAYNHRDSARALPKRTIGRYVALSLGSDSNFWVERFWAAMVLLAFLLLLFAFAELTARGQGLPPIVRGDTGLKSGSQPAPGFYVTNLTDVYDTHDIKTSSGQTVNILSIVQVFNATAFTYVSPKKILGANYAATVVVPVANLAIDTPLRDNTTGLGFSDMYFQPLQLGWHRKKADVLVGYAFVAPTGRFEDGARNNTGLGMWSHEISAGTTVYMGKEKTWHAATTGYFNIQSHVKGTSKKVGNVLSLEGGVGRDLEHGQLTVGGAYFTQWKVTDDKGFNLPPGFRSKHRYYGVGPEIDAVIPLNPKTISIFTFRFFGELGNRVATQGYSVYFAITIARPKH